MDHDFEIKLQAARRSAWCSSVKPFAYIQNFRKAPEAEPKIIPIQKTQTGEN